MRPVPAGIIEDVADLMARNVTDALDPLGHLRAAIAAMRAGDLLLYTREMYLAAAAAKAAERVISCVASAEGVLKSIAPVADPAVERAWEAETRAMSGEIMIAHMADDEAAAFLDRHKAICSDGAQCGEARAIEAALRRRRERGAGAS